MCFLVRFVVLLFNVVCCSSLLVNALLVCDVDVATVCDSCALFGVVVCCKFLLVC